MNEETIDKIVLEVKSQGLFDEFRKQSMADVDTKPAYQNLKQRVENTVQSFINLQKWSPHLNRNQLREKLRKNIFDAGYLETGVERIVDQVVNPNVIATVFNPQIEDLVYKYLGIEKPKLEPPTYEHLKSELEIKTDDLSNDLDELSPYSDKGDNEAGPSGHPSFETSDLVDDEEESPPFEPIAEVIDMDLEDPKSLDSQISGLTSQDSVESDGDKAKAEPKPESPPEIKEPPNDSRPEDINYSVDSQQQENDTQLSQVSSNESRLSIITDGDQASTSPRLDITEEAQMPSFNDNSDSFEKDDKSKTSTCNFDLNAGEKYEFKGTERKPVMSLAENSNLETTNTYFSEEKSETADVKAEESESAPKVESTDGTKTEEVEVKSEIPENGAPHVLDPPPAAEQAFKDEIIEALKKDDAENKTEPAAENTQVKKDGEYVKKSDSSSSRSHKHSSKSSSSERKRDRDRKTDHRDRDRDRSRDHHKSSSRDRDRSKASSSSSSSRHKSSRSSSSSSKHSKSYRHDRHRSKSSSSSEKNGKKKEEKISDDHSQAHNKPNPSDSNDGGGDGEGGFSAKPAGTTEPCAGNETNKSTTSSASSTDNGTKNSSTNVAATEHKTNDEVFLAPMPPPKFEEPGTVVSLSTPPVVIDVEFFTAQNQLSTDDVLDSIPTHIIYPTSAKQPQLGGEAKVKKPRFASNFSEARKLQKIRKKMGMQEQKRKDALLKQYLSVHPESQLAQQSQGLELEFACQPMDGQAGPHVSSPQKVVLPSPEPLAEKPEASTPAEFAETSTPAGPVNYNNNNEEKKEVEVTPPPTVNVEPEFFGFPLTDETFSVNLAAVEFLKQYAVHPPFQKPKCSQDSAFKIPRKRVRKPNNRFSSANFELENFDDVEIYNGVVEPKPATEALKKVVDKPIEVAAEETSGDAEVAKVTVAGTKRRHSNNRLQQCYSNDDLYKPRLSIGKRRRGAADSPPVDGKI